MPIPQSEAGEKLGEAMEPLNPEAQREEQAMCFCPVCSRRLVSQRCKLICDRCGYFMSCADYY